MNHRRRRVLRQAGQGGGVPEGRRLLADYRPGKQRLQLEDVIEGRPIFHQKDERVEAHVSVATLALFLQRTLEHQLAATLPELSSTDALVAMKSVGVAEFSLNGRTTRLVSGGGRDARRVLSALGITDIQPRNPEKPPKEPET